MYWRGDEVMREVLAILGCIGLLGVVGSPSKGQEPGWIIGSDDRKPIEDHSGPWGSIGQINIAFSKWRFRCTGVLIAPNVVLTAAHCLYNPWSHKPFSAAQVHFAVGVHLSVDKGRATGKCIKLHKDYVFERTPERSTRPQTLPLDGFQADIAAIVLDRDLSVAPAQLATGHKLEPGTLLSHAGYPEDRRQDLTGHMNCSLKVHDAQLNLWLTDCDSNRGSDGGPVFTTNGGVPKVAAIMATGSISGDFTVAVPITEFSEISEILRCP